MPKVTLKSVQEKYARLHEAAFQFLQAVRNPKRVGHSESPVNITNSEGQVKGRAIVSIEELIATAKSAEVLGYETRIQTVDGGKALRIYFVEDVSKIPVPAAFYEN